MALTAVISNPRNIHFDPDDLNNFQTPGTYFQNFKGNIYIGKGSYIAPNVGLITADHDLSNLDSHQVGEDIRIGEDCWIGMNAVVLPGVSLGPRTIVAAGAVVTRSFPDGNVVVAGVPARPIKSLSPAAVSAQEVSE
jgi:acetyltransferase-like isoleucine patch superfamily enzyme